MIRSRPAFERVIGSAHDAEDGPLARGDLVEGLRTEADDDLAPVALGRDETGVAKTLDMMGDERLGQSDVLDEVADGRGAARQAADDAEAIDVGQRLVERAQAAEVLGLLDERGDRAADPGRGRGQGCTLRETNER